MPTLTTIGPRPQEDEHPGGLSGRLGVDRLDAEERLRLLVAAEVHDGPLQLVLAAGQELDGESSDGARRARGLLADASAQLRAVLTPVTAPLSGEQARAALVRWCQALQAYRAFGYRVVVEDRDVVGRLELSIARELITNAVRHSGGQEVSVRLERHGGGETMVSVRDDGRGLPEGWEPGFGHSALQARTLLAGGAVAFHQPAGGGAFISVRLPVVAVDRPEP